MSYVWASWTAHSTVGTLSGGSTTDDMRLYPTATPVPAWTGLQVSTTFRFPEWWRRSRQPSAPAAFNRRRHPWCSFLSESLEPRITVRPKRLSKNPQWPHLEAKPRASDSWCNASQPTAPPRAAIFEERLPKEVLQFRRMPGYSDEEFVQQKFRLKRHRLWKWIQLVLKEEDWRPSWQWHTWPDVTSIRRSVTVSGNVSPPFSTGRLAQQNFDADSTQERTGGRDDRKRERRNSREITKKWTKVTGKQRKFERPSLLPPPYITYGEVVDKAEVRKVEDAEALRRLLWAG